MLHERIPFATASLYGYYMQWRTEAAEVIPSLKVEHALTESQGADFAKNSHHTWEGKLKQGRIPGK